MIEIHILLCLDIELVISECESNMLYLEVR